MDKQTKTWGKVGFEREAQKVGWGCLLESDWVRQISFKQQIKYILVTYLLQVPEFPLLQQSNPKASIGLQTTKSITGSQKHVQTNVSLETKLWHFKTRLTKLDALFLRRRRRGRAMGVLSVQKICQIIQIGDTTMSILKRSFQLEGNSVFIEDDHEQKVRAMRQLVEKGSSADIQMFFFPSSCGRELDINRLTNLSINKHQHSLSHRNKSRLKSVLKSRQDGELDTNQLKIMSQPTCCCPASSQDIHQYLVFDEEIDFGDSPTRN